MNAVRVQKLPYSLALAASHYCFAVARQARVLGASEVFLLSSPQLELQVRGKFFIKQFEESGALGRSALFLNLHPIHPWSVYLP